MNTLDLQLDHIDERIWSALKTTVRHEPQGNSARLYKTTLLPVGAPDAIRIITAPDGLLGRRFVLSLEVATQIDLEIFKGGEISPIRFTGSLLVLPGFMRSITLTNLRETTVEVSLLVVYGEDIPTIPLLLDGSWELNG
jgi:hypothetical protein